MSNHYETLGLSDAASDTELKQAFRRLAMQYHPDKNPGDSAAEAKFKDINEAYDVLKDRDKRAAYDHKLKHGNSNHHFGFHSTNFHNANMDDILRQFFGQNGSPFGNPFAQQPPRNKDFQTNIDITLEDAFAGKEIPLQFNANGQNINIVAKIPPGIEHGTKIRFQGHGDKSIPNVPPGDLYIVIHVLENSKFKREGVNLICELKLNAIDMIIGTKQDIKCLDNTIINVIVPAGSQHGTTLRIKEKGMFNRQNTQHRGDLFVVLQVVIPVNLSNTQIDTLRVLSAEITNNKH